MREHRSTIIFVNNRRGAERLAVRLNELAAEEDGDGKTEPTYIARAHHGSLAREERLVVEDLLKSGSCPAWSPPHRSSSVSTWAPWIW